MFKKFMISDADAKINTYSDATNAWRKAHKESKEAGDAAGTQNTEYGTDFDDTAEAEAEAFDAAGTQNTEYGQD